MVPVCGKPNAVLVRDLMRRETAIIDDRRMIEFYASPSSQGRSSASDGDAL